MATILQPVEKRVIPPVNILGVGVSVLNISKTLAYIQHQIDCRGSSYICCTNTHLICEAQSNPSLRRALNRAGLVTPDGMPLVWLSRLRGHPEVERVYGPDLLLAACERSLQTGWRHYFYGAEPGVAEMLANRLCERYPGLVVAGFSTPPFRVLSAEEDAAEVELINAAQPDILWVGLGAPKQELWMASHLGRITASVMVGVGAAFDFHAGIKKQAPRWMQRSGLEWLFRLFSEPKRLAKRYLVNNPLFLWLVFLQLSGLKKFPLEGGE
jgi:N-acetylglucosaminyldiphosphoundecaprenol N-acetyl-beta-D-mannosaminyltransferase